MKLPENECPPYFKAYLEIVSEDVLSELNQQLTTFPDFISQIPQSKELFRYAQGKWSIKKVVGHITDTERILSNRALRIARNDQTPIPPFNENDYVAATNFNDREIASLINDFKATRTSCIFLFKSLTDEELKRIGIASGKSVSARALFYFMAGHLKHHENIISEKYLSL